MYTMYLHSMLQVSLNSSDNLLTLSNGLISRQFILSPGFGTIDFSSLSAQRTILRAITPEATVTLDGLTYNVGGLNYSGTTAAYLNRTALKLINDSYAFQFANYSISEPVAPFHWKPGLRHSPADAKWPPEGLTLNVQFNPPEKVYLPEHANVYVNVSYEMYVGIPLLAKWVTVGYHGTSFVRIDGVKVEYLATQKPYAPFSYSPTPLPTEHDTGAYTSSWLYVETSIPHGSVVSWGSDPKAIAGADQPLLTVGYQLGPGVILINNNGEFNDPDYSNLKKGSNMKSKSRLYPRVTGPNPFTSFRVFELVTDSDDRERVALSRHRMTRLLAPQTQENPIFFHCTQTDSLNIRHAMDQLVDVGFEMLIFSFGSSFRFETTNDTYLDMIAADILYAHMNGLEVGG